MEGPIWEWSIPFLLVYFSPVAVGAFRRFRNRHASWPAWGLFLIVLLTGWSVIGWLWALRMAFRDKGLPDFLTQPSSSGAGGAGGIGETGLGMPVDETHPCPSCDRGSHYCSFCAGRGNWWEGSELRHCQSCGSTGRLTCSNCRGTGRVA